MHCVLYLNERIMTAQLSYFQLMFGVLTITVDVVKLLDIHISHFDEVIAYAICRTWRKGAAVWQVGQEDFGNTQLTKCIAG